MYRELRCLVIDNKVQSNNINDIVFWYKANDSTFKMCSRDLWEMQALQDQRELMGIENEEEDDGEDFDPVCIYKRKTLSSLK